MPELLVIQKIFNHQCGCSLRSALRLSGVFVGARPSEIQLNIYSQETRYYTSDAHDRRVIFCPKCGKRLPHAMETK